ncbi:serine/threonine protein kinase, partial [Reinekea sp.]
YVDPGDFDATLVSLDTPITHQFIKEQSAILQQMWVRVPLWSIGIAIGLALLPWLLLPFTRHPILFAILIVAIDVAVSMVMIVVKSVWVPIWGPLVMVLAAAVWYRNKSHLNQRINLLEKAHRLVAGYWVKSLLDDSKPESAYRFLLEQKTTLAYAPLWLDVANGYQRNRQLDKAQLCYQELLDFDPNCSEAKKGLKQLNDVIDGSKTMVIGQTRSELPVGHINNLSLGRYNITREIGRGAMGIVYEAIDPKINRNVALKVVHLKSLGFDEMDSVKQRFFREAQAAGKLNHPNIVTVYDVGEEHDVAYIAMDLLVGEPLSTHINQSPSIDITQNVHWIAQAADALSYAHDHEVIHRDVKPANMIIDSKTMQLKLTDFGVARIAGAQQTQTGIVLGSPSYMSPEQIRGDKLTGQTDVFSLGVTLYQALTQQLPFAGDTLPTLAYAITQGKQASPRSINKDVPVSLVRIVNKALNKDLVDRYQNAAEFSQALKKWLADQAK